MEKVLITGNTFPVKEALRALGGRWDNAAQGWWVPKEKAAAACALVSPPRQSAVSRRAWGRACGPSGCTSWNCTCDE